MNCRVCSSSIASTCSDDQETVSSHKKNDIYSYSIFEASFFDSYVAENVIPLLGQRSDRENIKAVLAYDFVFPHLSHIRTIEYDMMGSL